MYIYVRKNMNSLHVLLTFIMSLKFRDFSLVGYRNSLDFYAFHI